MRNIWTLIRADIAKLHLNVVSVVLTAGLTILPCVFAWYNTLAAWNVFENSGNLAVAVANDDVGYESDLFPLEINVGERVLGSLHANKQIDWEFTDSSEAIEGTKAGRYYAAVVIPKDFSRNLLDFFSVKEAKRAEIFYYVNEKKNAIAPRITNTGADSVSYEIGKSFAETVSEVVLAFSKAASTLLEEDGASAKVAALAGRLRTVGDQMERSSEVLKMYATLSRDSGELVDGSAELLADAKGRIDGTAADVASSRQGIAERVAAISRSVSNLSGGLADASNALAGLEDPVNEAIAGASKDARDAAAALRAKGGEIEARSQEYAAQRAKLEEIRSFLPAGHTLVIDRAISTLTKIETTLKDVAAKLTEAAGKLEAGDATVQSDLAELRDIASSARADVDAARNDFEANVAPSIARLKEDADQLGRDLSTASQNLNALDAGLSGTVRNAGSLLASAAGDVEEASGKLEAAAGRIRELADSIDAALASGDISRLKALLRGDAGSLAEALAAPVQVERTAYFPCESFGSAMSPMYGTLACFIGAVLIMMVLVPTVSEADRRRLADPKPWQLHLGRYGVVACLSLMQVTTLALGNLLFLDVQHVHPFLYMLAYWTAGLVFSFIIYTLVAAFENVGKALAVLLLVAQVTGSGGSYPLGLMPKFVQTIAPFLPAEHAVNAIRAAEMGVYQGDFWIELGELLLFIVPFLLLGLLARKPLERGMEWYLEKVEKAKIVI